MVLHRWLASLSFHADLIPEIRLFQILTLKRKVKVMGAVKGQGYTAEPAQYLINSHPFHFTPIRPTIPEIQPFCNLTLKTQVKVMREIKGQGCIVYPESNWCTSFSFHNHSWEMTKRVFDLEKTTSEIFKENSPKKFPTEFLQILIR